MKAKLSELSVTREGFDAAAAGRFIETEGAVIVRRVLTPDSVAALRGALVKALAEDEERRGPGYLFKGMVHALMMRGLPFRDFLGNAPVHETMRSVLGKGCIIHAYNSSSMPPGMSNYSRTIHVDSPRLIPGYVTNLGITVALDTFTADNGAMEIAPSLRDSFSAPDEATFNAHHVVLDNLSPGDAIIFNTRCWHRGGVNKTDKWRHAISMNVCRSYMRQQFDFPRLIGESEWLRLPHEVQQFLGCHVRMPVSMEEFLLPSERRPYRPGQE